MINTNIKNSHIRIENLYKSIFAQMHDISIAMHDQHIEIRHHDESNIDGTRDGSMMPVHVDMPSGCGSRLA